MKPLSRYFLFVATGLLALTCFGGVRALVGQTAEQAIDAPKPKQTVSPDNTLSGARRLSEQGKFDEAIAKLEALAAKHPDLKGVSHELGVTYYKKSDYLKAVASFKKALEEDPKDSEAVQLMGLLSQRECRRRVHPRRLLHADEGLSKRAQGFRKDVCRRGRFRGQLSVYGANVAAAGFWTRCRGVCKKGCGIGSQASAGAFAARRAVPL